MPPVSGRTLQDPSTPPRRVVSICVVLAYEYFITAFADTFWAKQPIVLVFPVQLLAVAWYLCMELVDVATLKAVFMELLGFWSAIGGIVIAEQLMVSDCRGVTACLKELSFTRTATPARRVATACPSSHL